MVRIMNVSDLAMQDCKLKAMQRMVQQFADIVDRAVWVNADGPPENDAVSAVAALYQSKAHGRLLSSPILPVGLQVKFSCTSAKLCAHSTH